MNRVAIAVVLGSWLAVQGAPAATNAVPLQQTGEIVDILKADYVDRDKLDEQTVDRATLSGILKSLGRGVRILNDEQLASRKSERTTPVVHGKLARAEIIQPDIGYIRITDVSRDTVRALDEELKLYSASKVTGYVLDLRFADGTNYEAAAAVASRFIDGDGELFTLKQAKAEPKQFHAAAGQKPPALDLGGAPVMLLVNPQTRGSAEAVVGALRAHNRGIVVGARTAGNPVATQDVKLADGRWLELVTAKITLPGGGEIFPNGITPDVPVKIDAEVERDAVLHAQTNLTLTASLQPKSKKKGMTEAELVKAFRGEASNATDDESIPEAAPSADKTRDKDEQPVRDVVLQRAVDILKGIRVLQSWR